MAIRQGSETPVGCTYQTRLDQAICADKNRMHRRNTGSSRRETALQFQYASALKYAQRRIMGSGDMPCKSSDLFRHTALSSDRDNKAPLQTQRRDMF